ncbi:hypothetical protein ABBQ32_005156 [Trebouxia sp. C0010 RCD-2024]
MATSLPPKLFDRKASHSTSCGVLEGNVKLTAGYLDPLLLTKSHSSSSSSSSNREMARADRNNKPLREQRED